jgi:hypothetical protein
VIRHARQRGEELRRITLRILLERRLFLLQRAHGLLGSRDGLLDQPERGDRGDLERPPDLLHRPGHHVVEQVHAVLQDKLVAGYDDVDHVLAENRQQLLLEIRDCGSRTHVVEVVGEVELEEVVQHLQLDRQADVMPVGGGGRGVTQELPHREGNRASDDLPREDVPARVD